MRWKKRAFGVLLCLIFSLTGYESGQAALDMKQFTIKIEKEGLTVRAEAVDPLDILDRVAMKRNVTIFLFDRLPREVSVDVHRSNLQELFDRVLRDCSHAVIESFAENGAGAVYLATDLKFRRIGGGTERSKASSEKTVRTISRGSGKQPTRFNAAAGSAKGKETVTIYRTPGESARGSGGAAGHAQMKTQEIQARNHGSVSTDTDGGRTRTASASSEPNGSTDGSMRETPAADGADNDKDGSKAAAQQWNPEPYSQYEDVCYYSRTEPEKFRREAKLREMIDRYERRIQSGQADESYEYWVSVRGEEYATHDKERLQHRKEQLEELLHE